MTVYGYARVSTADQDLGVQLSALKAAGCEIIRAEKVSGSSRDGRPELATLLEFLRPGDVLLITRIDRLARSVRDLANIVAELKGKGVALKATEQHIDASTPAGAAFLSMLSVFAEFELAIRAERQREGIDRAKAAGRYIGKGRPPVTDRASILALQSRGVAGATAIAKALGISRATVYRTLAD